MDWKWKLPLRFASVVEMCAMPLLPLALTMFSVPQLLRLLVKIVFH